MKDCLKLKCSKCCDAIFLPYPESDKDILRWVEFHDIKIVDNSKGRFIKIDNKCSKLKHGKCMIYESRPDICKYFDCEQFKEFFN